MILIGICIPGQPVPWARATGNGPHRSTPRPQADYKNIIKQYAFAAGARAKNVYSAGRPVELSVQVYLEPPRSWTHEQKIDALSGRIRPVSKPDLDNWIKLPMDALNGLVWQDDCQVVGFFDTGKWYSNRPRLEIIVRQAK